MNHDLAQKKTSNGGILLFALAAIPLVAGIVGMHMWFIPNPDLSIVEAVAGGGYTLLVVLLTWLVGRVTYVERWRQQIGVANLAIGSSAALLLIGFFSYFAASVAIPSEFARFFGNPSDRTVRVTNVIRHSTRASPFCPYSVTFQGLDGSAGAEFCMEGYVARHFHVGDEIHLHGRATYLGFRIDSYSV